MDALLAMKDTKKKMTLSQIYKWIRDSFAYYRKADKSWQVRWRTIPHSAYTLKTLQTRLCKVSSEKNGAQWDEFLESVQKPRAFLIFHMIQISSEMITSLSNFQKFALQERKFSIHAFELQRFGFIVQISNILTWMISWMDSQKIFEFWKDDVFFLEKIKLWIDRGNDWIGTKCYFRNWPWIRFEAVAETMFG